MFAGLHLKNRRSVIAAVTAFSALLLAAAPAQADTYPSRPIRLVVPSAAGGALDTLGRLLAKLMQKQSSATVVVDNKPGAAGSIGVQDAIRSRPDGYTFLISVPDAVTIYPMVNNKVQYRWDRDLTPLALLGVSSTIYAISGKSPANNLKEFLALTKQGEHNYATQGAGSSGHLLMEAFKTATGAKLTHIPYKGIAPALMSIVSGETSVLSTSPTSAAAYLANGRFKVLATTRPTRYASMPNVPTMTELGYPNLTLETWFGTFAPAGLPPEVKSKLINMLTKAIQSPVFKEQAEKFGLELKPPVTEEEFGKLVAADTAFWKIIIDRSNVKID